MSGCAVTPTVLIHFLIAPSRVDAECLGVLLSLAEPASIAIYPYLFAATVLLEAPFYLAGLVLVAKTSWRRAFALLLAVNVATHPFVSFLLPWLLGHRVNFGTHLAIGEIFAPIVEALLIWKLSPMRMPRALLLAVVANLASWTIGALVFA